MISGVAFQLPCKLVTNTIASLATFLFLTALLDSDAEIGSESAAVVERASSYEDIYRDVTPPLEDVGEAAWPGVAETVGDRHQGHVEPHHALMAGRASSYERLYEASHKEATHGDEKDVDEGTTDSDIERPEKGAGEDEKYYVQSPPQMFSSTRTDVDLDLELSDVKTSRSPSAQFGSPIDVTLEAGLDLVGHRTVSGEQRETFERSQSYEVCDEHDDDVSRQRRFSTPDVLPLVEPAGIAAAE